MSNNTVEARRTAPLATSGTFGANAARDIAGALNLLLADVFALYLKTKKAKMGHLFDL